MTKLTLRVPVEQLAPEALLDLVRQHGVEACSSLVAAAAPEQLTALVDLDLWKAAEPGGDETFDADRFGEWVEALVDEGPEVAATVVASLNTDIVVVGLSRYVRVFDPGTFEPTAQSDDEAPVRSALMREGGVAVGAECELGGYIVWPRRADRWDALVALLAALETEHSDVFHAVMRGCRRLSNSAPEVDGLDNLLATPGQHDHDVAIGRDVRRERRGYVSPPDARAFLEAIRRGGNGRDGASVIAADYLRMEPSTAAPAGPQSRVRLLTGAVDGDQEPTPVLRRLLEALVDGYGDLHAIRSNELVFLANVMAAGCGVQGRALTGREAASAAAAVCNLGLECWPDVSVPDTFLAEHDLLQVFETGWTLLYREVSLAVADGLLRVLDEIRSFDVDVARGLARLQHALRKERARGTPWAARHHTDVVAMLDAAVWVSVNGLLDELPAISAAVPALLERSTTPVSPTAFTFISRKGHLGDVLIFLRALPALLSR
jgi:hypothetical protein